MKDNSIIKEGNGGPYVGECREANAYVIAKAAAKVTRGFGL